MVRASRIKQHIWRVVFGLIAGLFLFIASPAVAQINLLPVIPHSNVAGHFERGFGNLRDAGGFPIRVANPVRTISPQIIERAFAGAGGGTVAFGFGAHSAPGLEGWSDIPGVTRAGVVRKVAETARQYGAHGLILDGSCGGGVCAQVWDSLPSDLKPYVSVITSGGRTQSGFFPSTYTGRVDSFLNIVTRDPRFDLNADGDLSMEELIKARNLLSQNGYPQFQTISLAADDFKRSLLSKKPGGGSSSPPPQPNTKIKAVCANLQRNRVDEEIPIFEGIHHPSFPVPNGSVTILDPGWEAALVNDQELRMLQAAEYTVQNKMPKFTEWQKSFIDSIRAKEVARFNAGSPAEGLIGGGGTAAARTQISEGQYHFVNVQGENTKDCAKDSSGNPQPGPVYESQRPVPPTPSPPSPPDRGDGGFQDFGRGQGDFGPGGGGGGGGGQLFSQLLPALLQSLLQRPPGGSAPPRPPVRPTPRPSPIASEKPVVCSQQYDPVCGVDGKTYSNRCVAEQQAKVAVTRTGACTAASQPAQSSVAGLAQSLLQNGVPGSLLMQIIRGIVGLLLDVFQT